MEDVQFNRLIIIGAGGHGRVVADIAKLIGYRDIVFLDDRSDLKDCGGYPVLGSEQMLPKLDGDIFVAIGDYRVRRRIMEREQRRLFPVLVHPKAILAEGVVIDCGSVIMAGAVINPGARIGKGCIINTASSVDHDCVVGDYCHLSVGAHLSGTVKVGDNTWIGAGAIVSNNINICRNAVIGAGAVVIRTIDVSGTYVGVPARKLLRENL